MLVTPHPQAADQTSQTQDIGEMVGPEVHVLVHVGVFPVDCCFQAAVTLPPENCGQKWEFSILLNFHGDLIEVFTPLRWSESASVVPFFTMLQVSSTYLFQIWGLTGIVQNASSSKNSHVVISHRSRHR